MATGLPMIHENHPITYLNILLVNIGNAKTVQKNEAPRWVHKAKVEKRTQVAKKWKLEDVYGKWSLSQEIKNVLTIQNDHSPTEKYSRA